MKSEHDKGMEVLAERFARQDEAYRRLGQFAAEVFHDKPVSEEELARYGSHSAAKLAWIYNAARDLGLTGEVAQ